MTLTETTRYNPIIVALDVPSSKRVWELIDAVGDMVGMVKIGLEVFTRLGPECVREIQMAGHAVMLDLKFHDIPVTVGKAVRAAAECGVALTTIHTSGGREMMEAARQARDDVVGTPLKLLGVTVLTSIDSAVLHDELNVACEVEEQVCRLAGLAKEAGLDGVVASPREIGVIRDVCGPGFLIVTPGIRPAGSAHNDQKRVCTPEQALTAGADYLVIGRPITGAADPARAARDIYHACRSSLTRSEP